MAEDERQDLRRHEEPQEDGGRAAQPPVVMAEPTPVQLVGRIGLYTGEVRRLDARLVERSPPVEASVVGVAGGAGGPMRARKSKRMERRLTHWQCVFCRHETPHSAGATACGACGGIKQQLGDADAAGREAARRRARSKEYVGRQLNALGVGTSGVPRAAQGVFEKARRDMLVRHEVEALEQFTGAASYVKEEDGMLGVMESFYIVQTGARVSVMDERKRAHVTEEDVAHFFNTTGRRVASGVAGETTFPMGGYFNEFRREGYSAPLVLALRKAVRSAIL